MLDPLLTYERYIDFIDASGKFYTILPKLKSLKRIEIANSDGRRDSLRTLVRGLPKPNHDTLSVLMLHLKRVERWSAVNGMPTVEIARIFGPLLLRANTKKSSGVSSVQITTIEKLLLHSDDIFADVSMEVSRLRPLHIIPMA